MTKRKAPAAEPAEAVVATPETAQAVVAAPETAQAVVAAPEPTHAVVTVSKPAPAKAPTRKKTPALDAPHLYLNREMAFLSFDQRVLELARDPAVPLLERVRFLSISCGNLDEFYEIRVAGLRQRLALALGDASLVLPVYTVYRKLVALHGESPSPDALSSDELELFSQWQAAESAALTAALGPHRYMGDAEFDIRA